MKARWCGAIDGAGGFASAHSTAALISSRSSTALALGSGALATARDTGTTRRRDSRDGAALPASAAATTSDADAPCAPTPGARIHASPLAARAATTASGFVAPTTSPSGRLAAGVFRPHGPSSRQRRATKDRSSGSWTSSALALLVAQSTKHPFPQYLPERKGPIAS